MFKHKLNKGIILFIMIYLFFTFNLIQINFKYNIKNLAIFLIVMKKYKYLKLKLQ